MGWDKGQYYTRSRKVYGRVVREYVGGGVVGALAARLDALGRQERAVAAAKRVADRADLDGIDEALQALIDVTDLVARAALLAAGYRQHKRGEWRKRRVRIDQGSDPGPDGKG